MDPDYTFVARVGGAVLRWLLRAFGAQIVYADLRPLPPDRQQELGASRLGLDQLMNASDIIIATAPLTQAIRRLLGPDMRPKSAKAELP
jgi:lactate dehydrogenase-like 2-hydroxyacid dehydrogenase